MEAHPSRNTTPQTASRNTLNVQSPKSASAIHRGLSTTSNDIEAVPSPAVNVRRRFTIWDQVKTVIFRSWLNLALVPIVVAGFVVRYTRQAPAVIFAVNTLAIVLLGSWLSYATKELALRAGGWAMAFVVLLSNVIQLIVTVIALVQDQIVIVQTSLVGSVVSNMVLLTGVSLLVGAYNREEQYFDAKSVDFQLSYLFLIIGVVGISTAWEGFGNPASPTVSTSERVLIAGTFQISCATSILLIAGHILFIAWAFSKPVRLYAVESQTSSKIPGRSVTALVKTILRQRRRWAQRKTNTALNGELHTSEEEDGEPQINIHLAVFILVAFTILIGFCATFAVESVDNLTKGTMTANFVGLILFPIFSYNFDAIFLAREDRLNYTFVITIGGSMQILAIILPLAVIIGWITGKPNMVLSFDLIQVAIMAISCIAMKHVCKRGAIIWIDGVILVALYFIIATAAWFYNPQS